MNKRTQAGHEGPPTCQDDGLRRIIHHAALTLALYTLLAWIYVAAVAVVTPQYLPLQLTHLLRWPRTDTFGEVCFVVSAVSFFVYRMTLPDRVSAAATGT